MGKSVLLFTGPGRHGAGNVEENLRRLGVEVTRVSDDRCGRINRVPKGSCAIVFMRDVLPERLHQAVRDLAHEAGIPLIPVERNWSRAAPALRTAGIIDSLETQPTVEEEEPVADNVQPINKPSLQSRVPAAAQASTQLPPEVMEAVKLLADSMRSNQSVVFVTIGRNGSGFQIDYQVINPTNGSVLL